MQITGWSPVNEHPRCVVQAQERTPCGASLNTWIEGLLKICTHLFAFQSQCRFSATHWLSALISYSSNQPLDVMVSVSTRDALAVAQHPSRGACHPLWKPLLKPVFYVVICRHQCSILQMLSSKSLKPSQPPSPLSFCQLGCFFFLPVFSFLQRFFINKTESHWTIMCTILYCTKLNASINTHFSYKKFNIPHSCKSQSKRPPLLQCSSICGKSHNKERNHCLSDWGCFYMWMIKRQRWCW